MSFIAHAVKCINVHIRNSRVRSLDYDDDDDTDDDDDDDDDAEACSAVVYTPYCVTVAMDSTSIWRNAHSKMKT